MVKSSLKLAPRVLIGDDQPEVLRALQILLKPEGFQIKAVSSTEGVLAAVEDHDFDVVLMDLNYVRGKSSGSEGLDLLSRIQKVDGTLPVVVMTAYGSGELAVEAMRRGARDFVTKPWKNERLLTILRTQVELGRALRQQQHLEQENLLLKNENRPLMIAESRAMAPILEAITRVGPSEANVLITGENGSGKGVAAQAMYAASARKDKSIVKVNTASIAETIFESELFGHVAGAFTGAKSDRLGRFKLADGGTLFLDEIATIPTNLQAKLLRVLESGEFEPVGSSKTSRVNVRILSATNADLGEEVREGRFRQDLLYRLNTVELHIPPLRERREDIPLLAQHFLQRHTSRYRKKLIDFNPDALDGLINYSWPGNVRELDHTVERGVLMAKGEFIRVNELALAGRYSVAPKTDSMTLEEMECMMIINVLSKFDGEISKSANQLGLSRSALYRRLEKYGIIQKEIDSQVASSNDYQTGFSK
ncbi:MAG: sigma-54-dependent Fis family transcriptional regulator [Planctomycetes bacterium]|nr:sigma-54-dependent Fis family transcriptional regulator [Planctomycetota bacterium]